VKREVRRYCSSREEYEDELASLKGVLRDYVE
jgi:hypothetical protein